MTEHNHSVRSLRSKVYWWIERPDRDAIGPKVLEVALILLILMNVTAVILETEATIYANWKDFFAVFEGISISIFITRASLFNCADGSKNI